MEANWASITSICMKSSSNMSSLTLVRRPDCPGPLDLAQLIPELLLARSTEEIAATQLGSESGSVALDQAFEIRDGHRDRLILSGDFSDCQRVAAGMTVGDLLVDGSVGDFLSAEMRGGRVEVTGHAGRYACSALRGGQVTIRGNVGRHATSAPPLATRGMSGGTVLIGGDADEFLGCRLRRGNVIVLGNIAAGCASRMIAGTLVAAGQIALPLGYAMARGTLLVLNPSPELVERGLPGFTPFEPCELSFLPLLLRDMAPHLPVHLAGQLRQSNWRRAIGDRAEGGQGEIIVRNAATTSAQEAQNYFVPPHANEM
jgi:formylmethanofuran dehydrogenase subunit C